MKIISSPRPLLSLLVLLGLASTMVPVASKSLRAADTEKESSVIVVDRELVAASNTLDADVAEDEYEEGFTFAEEANHGRRLGGWDCYETDHQNDSWSSSYKGGTCSNCSDQACAVSKSDARHFAEDFCNEGYKLKKKGQILCNWAYKCCDHSW